MLVGLASMLLAQAATAPQDQPLLCMANFADRSRFGNVLLLVDPDYTPHSLEVSIRDFDGWTRFDITLDPTERRLPGRFSGAFFAVRFTRAPIFPLTMNAYADGMLRWRHPITSPYWVSSLDSPGAATRRGRDAPGTTDYISRADDGLPVPTPRELKIVLIDARGREVGESRYALPGAGPDDMVAPALAAVEAGYRAHSCHVPVPPPD